jgi:3-carboxy-cis,cis-muconate cycloisomerase
VQGTIFLINQPGELRVRDLPESVDELFTSESLWQSWLDVEAALALSQGELGMIPARCATRIAGQCRLSHFDLPGLKAEIARSMAPVLSLTRALAVLCGEEAGGYVHWGATTQNVVMTGRLLQLRKAHALLLGRLAEALDAMADLASAHAGQVMVGRTNRKHALPITFGFKVASWIDEMLRCVQRLRETEARTFRLVFGGAIGAMQSFGAQGPALAQALAARLGLRGSLVHARNTLDSMIEYVLALALFGTACSRVGKELYALMAEEIDEVEEALGPEVVGSSTMPQKNNPKYVVALLARAARLRALAAPALEAGQPSHEGDAACNQLIAELVDQAAILAYELAGRLADLLRNLRVRPESMRRNLAMSADVVASENLMLQLAQGMGRQAAHDLVHELIIRHRETGAPVLELLLRHPGVAGRYDAAQLRRALDPACYTGMSADIALSATAQARQEAAAIRAAVR